MLKNPKTNTLFVIGIILLINLIFFLITYNSRLFSDDYQSIIGIKLYNLIQSKSFSFSELFELRSDGHFVPMFYFVNQLLPDNPIYIHLTYYTIMRRDICHK